MNPGRCDTCHGPTLARGIDRCVLCVVKREPLSNEDARPLRPSDWKQQYRKYPERKVRA